MRVEVSRSMRRHSRVSWGLSCSSHVGVGRVWCLFTPAWMGRRAGQHVVVGVTLDALSLPDVVGVGVQLWLEGGAGSSRPSSHARRLEAAVRCWRGIRGQHGHGTRKTSSPDTHCALVADSTQCALCRYRNT